MRDRRPCASCCSPPLRCLRHGLFAGHAALVHNSATDVSAQSRKRPPALHHGASAAPRLSVPQRRTPSIRRPTRSRRPVRTACAACTGQYAIEARAERHRDRAAHALLVAAGLVPAGLSRIVATGTPRTRPGLRVESIWRRPQEVPMMSKLLGNMRGAGRDGGDFTAGTGGARDRPQRQHEERRDRGLLGAAYATTATIVTTTARVTATTGSLIRWLRRLRLRSVLSPGSVCRRRHRTVRLRRLVGRTPQSQMQKARLVAGLRFFYFAPTASVARLFNAARLSPALFSANPAHRRTCRRSPLPPPSRATPDACGHGNPDDPRSCGSRSRRSARPA